MKSTNFALMKGRMTEKKLQSTERHLVTEWDLVEVFKGLLKQREDPEAVFKLARRYWKEAEKTARAEAASYAKARLVGVRKE